MFNAEKTSDKAVFKIKGWKDVESEDSSKEDSKPEENKDEKKDEKKEKSSDSLI